MIDTFMCDLIIILFLDLVCLSFNTIVFSEEALGINGTHTIDCRQLHDANHATKILFRPAGQSNSKDNVKKIELTKA